MRQIGLLFGTADMLTVTRDYFRSKPRYRRDDGSEVRARHLIAHYQSLAIPPAWSDVRLASDMKLHLQAVGRDTAGRSQYRYHDGWVAVRDTVKWERLKAFGRALPDIRAVVASDLRNDSDIMRMVCAAAIHLIDQTNMRPGSTTHTRLTGTRGATTILTRQVSIGSNRVELSYTAKGGKDVEKLVHDRRLAEVLHRCAESGGRRLFDVTFGGEAFRLSPSHLNDYLKMVGGRSVSVKDFRTFEGSARAIEFLAGEDSNRSQYYRRRCLVAMANEVSHHLHNTPQMARKSYVHPRIIKAWEAGQLSEKLIKGRLRRGLERRETALMRFIERA